MRSVTRFQFTLCWVAFFCPAGNLRGSLHTQTTVTVVPRWSIVSLDWLENVRMDARIDSVPLLTIEWCELVTLCL
ncbi:hypothetical protein LSH36_37g13067 [Paralvinella palmiformis]|uniref:Secreted protein n=1 Tax=Paralvinella palmiformis TaxID=53620 RepID=A0AAD9K8V3_9ANNE|nr:hypothetical protein LSH36_37g13067 [Paralvinella palmiformis]